MKHSMRLRLILLVCAVLIVALAGIFAANIFLLPTFYQSTKVSQMSNVYDDVYEICSKVSLSDLSDDEEERIYDQLDKLGGNRGVSIYIMQIQASDDGSIANINYVYPTGTSRL